MLAGTGSGMKYRSISPTNANTIMTRNWNTYFIILSKKRREYRNFSGEVAKEIKLFAIIF